MKHLIVYDITRNKRRQKIVKLLERAGGQRVQKSVFELDLSTADLLRLLSKLHKQRGKRDSIRCYAQCKTCAGKKYLDEAAGHLPDVDAGIVTI